MLKKISAVLAGLFVMLSAASCGGKTTVEDVYTPSDDLSTGFYRTAGSDDFGRSFSQVEQYNENVVGIFYFLWLSQASKNVNVDSYEKNGEVEKTLGSEVSYAPTFTYWGEPLYGYYKVEDEWVVRKHVELFINAGLDFICFDTTNNDYYEPAARTVLNVLLEYNNKGYNVPKAMFMTNSDSTGMTESIYTAFYRRETYDSIWFKGNGDKPWIIADYAGDNQSVKDRFYFKAAQWPIKTYNSNKFPWISFKYPQETFTDNNNGYVIKSVSVSQHPGINSGINFSLSGLCSPSNYATLSVELKKVITEEKADRYYNANWGRGYSHETGKNNSEDAIKNVNFEEQWNTVWNDPSVNLVFVTGWNEWIAQKQVNDPTLGKSYGYFVDTFNSEFSRDIEMSADGYLDNCYMQLVKNVRKFKGSGYASKTYESRVKKGTDMFNLGNWKDITSYADLTGETAHRDAVGVGGTRYVNDTGRNDITEVRVASDDDNLWFMIATAEDITEKQASDTRWMNLWIGKEGAENAWNGLEYVINRSYSDGVSSIDKIVNGASFEKAGDCEVKIKGNVMVVKVFKSSLGISGNGYGIQFKVTDNLAKDFDVADYYVNGDCAPLGRVNYSYYTK